MPNVIKGADAWMIQGRDGPRLAFEALSRFKVFGMVSRQDFYCNATIQARIARSIDLAHAARAEQRFNFISAQL